MTPTYEQSQAERIKKVNCNISSAYTDYTPEGG